MPEEGKYKNKYRIKSIRHSHWNYAQGGFYFITICAKGKNYYFGDVVGGETKLSVIGEIAKQELFKTIELRENIELDEWVIMPNHIHAIIAIVETRCGASQDADTQSDTFGILQNDTETRRSASLQTLQTENVRRFGALQKSSLSSILNNYKGAVKNKCNKLNIDFAWQDRFYDRIIRNDTELNKIRKYIIENPLKWELDKNNPENLYM